MNNALDWIAEYDAMLWWLFAGSAVLLLATPPVVAWIVMRLPSNYFVQPKRQRSWGRQNPVWRTAIAIGKNLVGFVLLVAGVVMLLVPGQGLLTIAVGLLLVDFPGKFRMQRWLITRKPVWHSINWLRKRTKRPPLERPDPRRITHSR